MPISTDPASVLPADGASGALVGRVWRAGDQAGPSVVAVRAQGVFDISRVAPTMADLCEKPERVEIARHAEGEGLGTLDSLLAATCDASDSNTHLIAPVDLQAIKACGVTFAKSMLERVIEERAGGDPAKAEEIRTMIRAEVGADLAAIRPGSEAAERLKASLQDRGLWSQYIEVGIGPYAEVFTKSQPMSAVGHGAAIGLHPLSGWNNPEPEIALIVNSRAEAVGATLGNDVNLRDFEGRSALLLGKAKDNNGSCALGPFIRLFDDRFTIDAVRAADVSLTVDGTDDGFHLEAVSSMREISRDPLDLVGQTIGPHHQYPDGLALFLGTMFAPTEDRGAQGLGFTHHIGDHVTIATPVLGALTNRVDLSTAIAPWTFGARALMRNLEARGLIGP